MQRLRVPGVTIAVIKDFQIHWAKGYGVADVETGRRVETKTTFQAASISKPVTAMAAIRLVQEHRLELDTSVDPPEPLVTITRVRGSRSLRNERRIKGLAPMQQLTEDDVIEMLLEELRPWLG